MNDFSQRSINEIDTLYRNMPSTNNLEEQQSDVSKQWERGARWFGKATDKYVANPVSSAVRAAADYTGQALSGVTRAATGGAVDLEKIGKDVEKLIGTGGSKPAPKPATAKSSPTPTAPTKPKPQQRDSGREAGEYLAPSLGSPKAADPLVRSGGSYGFFGAIKPATAKPATAKPAPAAAKPAPKPTNTGVKKDPRGAVIVNHFENENDSLVTEAPAQVAPITGTGGKGWYQKNKDGKYVPITDPELAKQAAARWKAEKNKPAKPAPKPQPETPKPAPETPKPSKPASEAPKPTPQASKPAPTPSTSSASASTAEKIRGGSEVYKRQIKMGDVKGAEKTGMDVWRAKYANTLAKNVTPSGTQKGTGQSVMAKQAAELRSLRPATAKPAPGNEKPGYSGPPTPTEPQAQSKLSGGAYSSDATKLMSQRSKNILGVKEGYDAFDLVMEYLLSQGHVGTLDEALYVMMEMDSECIQSIVENVSNEPKLKPGSGLGGGKPTYEKGKEPKPTGAKLPTLPSA